MTRICTCNPDDRPPVCQMRYAASECMEAYLRSCETPLPSQTELELRDQIRLLNIKRAQDQNIINAYCDLVTRLKAENEQLARDLAMTRLDLLAENEYNRGGRKV